MSLSTLLQHRRAIRLYDKDKALDTARVRQCLELAQLAPTSSNLQLWEAYHITDPHMLQKAAHICLDQRTASSAQQIVVFVTRQDLHKSHAQAVYKYEIENVRKHLPEDMHTNRWNALKAYYTKAMPFFYTRAWGLLGLIRKTIAFSTSLFRPMMTMVSEADSRITVHKSCALVAQTFMLAMAEVGYDTCPMEGFDSKRLKKLLKLPAAAEINMVVSCGVRADDGIWGERFRLPLGDIYYTR